MDQQRRRSHMKTLKKRSEFLAVATGGRTDRRAFALQGLARGDGDAGSRVGYTVTKKTGNAVERNRIRRRLRAAVAELGTDVVPQGADYVIIGRRAALSQPFSDLVRDLISGLKPALDPKGARPRHGGRPTAGKGRSAGPGPDKNKG
ncbi:ribonuclease P protein component [Pannonibacter tanglangensis]|nr:ribonuclease P protein component [Pannonibacter sp. XCT-34]